MALSVGALKTGTADEPKVDEEQPEPKTYPTKIRLRHLYGFYNENNSYQEWKAGFVSSDPNEIKMLVDRGAIVDVVEL